MRRPPAVIAALIAALGAACASQPGPAAPPESPSAELVDTAGDVDTTDSAGDVDTPDSNGDVDTPDSNGDVDTADSNGDVDTADSNGDVVVPEGFDRVAARVTAADGSVCELCLWLADTAPRRARGLMSVTDLGEADGMAFRYPEPHTTNFWMKDTLLPLSIAFFDADGRFLSAFDMEPCTRTPCPRYPTAQDFTVAVEVPRGALDELGIAAGSRLVVTALPCDVVP